MKKIIFGIFAHPDDEAFGPSGYFLDQVKRGAELHLITLTLGQHGINRDHHEDLASVRKKEWQESGRLMGAMGHYDLGFVDGHLCNIEMIEASEKIQAIVDDVVGVRDVEIEFVTNDLNGITGHIDHIVAARAASQVFFSRREQDSRYTRIRYACITRTDMPEINTNWIFMEPGRSQDEISHTVDTTAHRDQIIAIMRAHYTQRDDGEQHIRERGERLGMYSFIDFPR